MSPNSHHISNLLCDGTSLSEPSNILWWYSWDCDLGIYNVLLFWEPLPLGTDRMFDYSTMNWILMLNVWFWMAFALISFIASIGRHIDDVQLIMNNEQTKSEK